ncbi:hypothetical protein Trydic_g14565 [Trypoxylus dichotomus]
MRFAAAAIGRYESSVSADCYDGRQRRLIEFGNCIRGSPRLDHIASDDVWASPSSAPPPRPAVKPVEGTEEKSPTTAHYGSIRGLVGVPAMKYETMPKPSPPPPNKM